MLIDSYCLTTLYLWCEVRGWRTEPWHASSPGVCASQCTFLGDFNAVQHAPSAYRANHQRRSSLVYNNEPLIYLSEIYFPANMRTQVPPAMAYRRRTPREHGTGINYRNIPSNTPHANTDDRGHRIFVILQWEAKQEGAAICYLANRAVEWHVE